MKNVYGNLYVHKSNLKELPNSDKKLLFRTIQLLPPNITWNLVKVARDKTSISFMNYPNFFENPHPALREYTKVDLETGTTKHSKIMRNPPILHRKETFIALTNPSYYVFKQLTEQEEKAGLYQKSLLSKIGRRDYWNALLAKKNLTIRDHRLILKIREVDSGEGESVKENRDRYDVLYSPYAWRGGDNTGQNHVVDNERDPSKTLCGKRVFMWEGTGLGLENVTCLICRRILEKRRLYPQMPIMEKGIK